MLRNVVLGVFMGLVVSVIVLAVASEVGDTVDLSLPAPDAAEVELPPGTEFDRPPPDEPPVLPSTEAPRGGGQAPEVSQPVAGALPEADTASAGVPEAGAAEDGLAPPAAETPGVANTPGAEEALPEQADATRPAEPGVDAAPSAVPEPATPDVGEDTTAPEGPTVADQAGAAPAAEQQVAEVPEVGLPEGNAPDAGFGSAAAPAPAQVVTEAAELAQPGAGPSVPDAPPAAMPEAPGGLRLPVPEIAALDPSVTNDRLPRIGAEPEPAPEDATPREPAITAFAVPYESAPGVPVVSVVLLDIGAVRPDPATLDGFPLPLTVALDPLADGAREAMAAYRAAGAEVAVLTPLPEGATPADVEVAFQVYLNAVPEAVAVMDLPDAILQESRPRAAQVAAILKDTGHGLLTYDRGLNMGLQVAERENVPAATVFRQFDGEGRNVAAMKRFLDQGAFRAGQSGTVIMLGETRADTLQALAEWALGTRAGSVALAPLSAALLAP